MGVMAEFIPATAPRSAFGRAQLAGLTGFIERRPGTAFGGFLALHFAVWTALPALLYANLPLDLIEALTYGREWKIGYDKLPPLPWWLVEIVHRLCGAAIRSATATASHGPGVAKARRARGSKNMNSA